MRMIDAPSPLRAPDEPLLQITDLSVTFPLSTGVARRLRSGQRQLHAVREVSLTLGRGASLAIVGESGSGKTTLARAICGLVTPTSGEVRINVERRAAATPPVQMVFQDPTSSLDPRQTAADAISEMLRVHRLDDRDSVAARTGELLTMVGLTARAGDARPRQLSGGQRQRVAIARALALQPAVLIADEAVASLDVSVKAGILNLLRQLQRQLGLTLIVITHDLATVGYVADEMAVMYLGSVVEQGAVAEVLTSPRHPYTQALLSAVPRLSARDGAPGVGDLAGEPPSPLSPPAGCPFHPRCRFAQESCRLDRPSLVDVGGGHHVACPILAPPPSQPCPPPGRCGESLR